MVSRSRISPSRITFGAWRSAARNARRIGMQFCAPRQSGPPPPHDFHGHLIEAEGCLEEGGVHGKEKEGDEGRSGGFGGSP
jgi:hypothetical protein